MLSGVSGASDAQKQDNERRDRTLSPEKVESTSTTSDALHHAIATPRLSYCRQSEALVVTARGNAELPVRPRPRELDGCTSGASAQT